MAASSLQVLLLFLLSLPFSICQSPCSQPAPIQIPIRNVTLPGRNIRRGIALSFGTPIQNVALQAHADANNTYVFDAVGFCASDPLCSTYKGGMFTLGSSSTWNQVASLEDSGASSEPSHGSVNIDVWGTDSVRLNPTLSIEDFPIGISRTNEWETNVLGMGRNSTILNSLLSVGKIASRTWGMFWGWTGAEADFQMDGSLVLGGYDAAKTTGRNFTDDFQIDSGCRTSLLVNVKDIVMNHPNGSSTSIMDGSSPMRACVAPDAPVITIPLDKWISFALSAPGTFINRSYGINIWGMVYDAKDVYAGDLTFTLASGLNIRIPNHQLVVPDLGVNPDGRVVILNSKTREILINSLQDVNKDDMPLLGQPFLSAAYLLVDNDRRKFTIWQNNATRSQKIVAIGPSATCTSAVPTASTISATSTSAPSSAKPPSRLTKGGIAGTVVGLVGGVVLLGIASILLWRRRQPAHRKAVKEGIEGMSPYQETVVGDPSSYNPELEHPPQDIPSTGDQAYELPAAGVDWN